MDMVKYKLVQTTENALTSSCILCCQNSFIFRHIHSITLYYYIPICLSHLISIGADSAIYLRIAQLACICTVVHFTYCFILAIQLKIKVFFIIFKIKLAYHMHIWWKVYNNMVIEWIWWNMNLFWPDNALTSSCIICSELVHISPYPFNNPIEYEFQVHTNLSVIYNTCIYT